MVIRSDARRESNHTAERNTFSAFFTIVIFPEMKSKMIDFKMSFSKDRHINKIVFNLNKPFINVFFPFLKRSFKKFSNAMLFMVFDMIFE